MYDFKIFPTAFITLATKMNVKSIMVLVLLLLLIGIVSSQPPSEGFCVNTAYHTLGGKPEVSMQHRCCKGTVVRPGVSGNWFVESWKSEFGLLKVWTDPPADENENITMSAWRAYTTTLSIWLPKGQISFTNFTAIMIKNYKEGLQNSIVAAARLAIKNADPETKKVMQADFELTNYENVNKIRVIYFGIEKSVCSGKSFEPNADFDMWNNCDLKAELEARDGGCCRNNTVPFSNLNKRNPYGIFQCQNCSKLLDPFLQKLKLTDPEDERTLVLQTTCRVSCFLIENKVITAESLIDVKETDEFPIDDALEILTPTFISKSVRVLVKNAVKQEFDLKKVRKAMPAQTALGDKVKTEDLLACYAHDVIQMYIEQALDSYCNPKSS